MISVALCSYNGEQYIREQLNSILSQSMPVDEIVICDDCSIDSTFEILESYKSTYSQIRLFKNPQNLGYRKNFEKAIDECSGDYIFFSDQDDIWMKNKVEETINFFRKTNYWGVFSDAQLIDSKGGKMGHTLFSCHELYPYINDGLIMKYMYEILCLKGNFVTGATLAIKKEAKNVILPFKTSKYILHDTWVAIKLSSIDRLGIINTPLIKYRIHERQNVGVVLNIKDGEDLLKCFRGEGSIDNLLRMRRPNGGMIYLCKLGKEERRRLFTTYACLYKKSMSRQIPTRFKQLLVFLLMECFVFIQSRIGYGLGRQVNY